VGTTEFLGSPRDTDSDLAEREDLETNEKWTSAGIVPGLSEQHPSNLRGFSRLIHITHFGKIEWHFYGQKLKLSDFFPLVVKLGDELPILAKKPAFW